MKEEEEEERDKNLPDFVLSSVKQMEEDLSKQIANMEADMKIKIDKIDSESELKKKELENEMLSEKLKIEQEMEQEISKLRYEYDSKAWKLTIDTLLDSVDHKIYSLQSYGEFLSKASTHIPKLEIIKNHDKEENKEEKTMNKVMISLSHGVSVDHFIGTVWLRDEATKNIIGFKEFMKTNSSKETNEEKDDKKDKEDEKEDPIIEAPQVEFVIAENVRKVTAFAHCNLHGVWSSEEVSINDSNSEATHQEL